jgi:peptidoglycan/LPS O-acetylase OafA/YrhL
MAAASSGASAPPAVSPPPGNPRFPLFDGLRAIAALSVVLYHAFTVTGNFGGWQGSLVRQLPAGVTVFFLISGFLLYRPFVAARLSGRSPIRLRDYTRRRLLRIVPAYWFALTVLAVWPGLPGRVFSSDAWIFYGFAQDYGRSTVFQGLGTAWSLGTEVVFYAVLPLYAFILSRSYFRKTAYRVLTFELCGLGTLAVGSMVFRHAAFDPHPNLNSTLLGTFDWFAFGMGLAVISAVTKHVGSRPRALEFIARHPSACWAASLSALCLAAAYWSHSGRTASPYSAGAMHVLWGVAALFLILPAVFEHPARRLGVPRRLLSLHLMQWLGLVSYGIYLWHLPLVIELRRLEEWLGIHSSGLFATVLLFGLTAVVSVGCAAFSYYVVERPLLRLKERRRPRSATAPAIAAATPSTS